MNKLREFLLNRNLSAPKNADEAQYLLNKRATKAITKYIEEVKQHDPNVELPAMFDAFKKKDMGGSIIESVKGMVSAIGIKRVFPFIARKDPQYLTPEYNLLTVQRFLNSEPIFTRAVRRYIEQIMQRGFRIVSQSKDNLDYVNKKLNTLEMAMSGANPGKWTFRKFVSDISYNVVTYGNSYVYRKRDINQAFGNSWRLFGHVDSKLIDPVAGLFHEDPVKIRTRIDKFGKIIDYVIDPFATFENINQRSNMFNNQRLNVNSFLRFGLFNTRQYTDKSNEDIIRYLPEEIDHIKGPLSQDNLSLAMPLVWPVIPDIKALRMLEENVELLAYQYSTGILHGQIGTPEQPMQPGEDDLFRSAIESSEGNGAIITSSRWSLKIIGPEGQALNLQPYLEWFFNRILMGLGTNPAMMGLGESTNKASSGSLHVAFQGSVILFQQIIADYITSLFDHFLYESGVKFWQLDSTNRVYYIPIEIDINNKVLVENATIQKWINNTISFNEMRAHLGESPLKENDGLFFKDFVTAEAMQMNTDAQLELVQAQAKANKSAVSNKTAPANGSGKKAGPKSKV